MTKDKNMTDIQCLNILTGGEQSLILVKKTWHKFKSSPGHRSIEKAKEMHGNSTLQKEFKYVIRNHSRQCLPLIGICYFRWLLLVLCACIHEYVCVFVCIHRRKVACTCILAINQRLISSALSNTLQLSF